MSMAMDRIRAYYLKYTRAAEDIGHKRDAKRLREYFGEDRIELRYDERRKQWQVWYKVESGWYNPYSLDPYEPLNI